MLWDVIERREALDITLREGGKYVVNNRKNQPISNLKI